ncbi:MAG: hypothetical protein ABJP52_17045, partial [Flavobacteriaceae bacterium]
VREHSEQPLCSLLGEWDNQTSLMIKYHAMVINHDHPKSKSKVLYSKKSIPGMARPPTPQTRISQM